VLRGTEKHHDTPRPTETVNEMTPISRSVDLLVYLPREQP
jgi:hypothetical protein